MPRYHMPRFRLLALILLAVLLIGGGAVAWYAKVGAPMAPASTPARPTMVVTLHLGCGGCVPCPRSCPACDNKLASVVQHLPGVTSAVFHERSASGTAVVRFDPHTTTLTTIERTIERSPPYPGCCTGLSVVSRHAA